jgi:peptidoglycan/xylan/chitin deacetylase (PgdA/CDA1 family)
MKLLAVNFHYVRDEVYENGIYPRSIKQISQQIDVLSKSYTFISQDELIDKIKRKEYDKRNYCLLTFDDGLKEQMNALELLNKKGIPAIFYVTTNSIKNNTVVDVHKLHYIRSLMDDKDVNEFIAKNMDTTAIEYPRNINDLYRYDSLETKKLKYLLNFILEPTLKTQIIDRLLGTVIEENTLSKQLYMTKENIKQLGELGYLGTHSDLHLPLATLSDVAIRKDIRDSMEFISDARGTNNIQSISYPYGGPKAVSQNVADISKEFGFTFGLTMFRGINERLDFENPLMLKRVDTNDAPGGKSNSMEFCL